MEIDPLEQHDFPRHEVEKVGIFFFFSFYEFQVN